MSHEITDGTTISFGGLVLELTGYSVSGMGSREPVSFPTLQGGWIEKLPGLNIDAGEITLDFYAEVGAGTFPFSAGTSVLTVVGPSGGTITCNAFMTGLDFGGAQTSPNEGSITLALSGEPGFEQP